jgi:hypothetical protein
MRKFVLVTTTLFCLSTPIFAKKGKHSRVDVEKELSTQTAAACKSQIRYDFSKAWSDDPNYLDADKRVAGFSALNMLKKACIEDAKKVTDKIKTVAFVTPETGKLSATVASGKLTISLPLTGADGLVYNWGWSDNEKINPVIEAALRKGTGVKLLSEEEAKNAEKEAAASKERAEADKVKKADEARDKELQKKQESRDQEVAKITKEFQDSLAKIQREKAGDPQGMAAALEAAQLKMQKRMQELDKK